MSDLDSVLPGDFAITSGRVMPMSPDPNPVSTIVLRDERIVEVGGRELATHLHERNVPFLDFGDRPVLPGFIDTHVHLEILSLSMSRAVSIHSPPCESIDDIVGVLRENLSRADELEGWLLGEGNAMQDCRLKEGRLPTRHDLDKVSKRVPIAVRVGGHTTVLNTPALQRLDLEEEQVPQGAIVERGDDGTPTGILREYFYLLPIPAPSPTVLREAVEQTARDAFTRFGVTSIAEIPRSVGAVSAMDDGVAAGDIQCRIQLFVRKGPMGSLDEVIALAGRSNRAASDRFKIQGVKLFADGGFSSATAATLRPWAIRPGSRGRLTYRRPQLEGLIERIADAGLQPMIHAAGERAQRAVCDIAVQLGLADLSGGSRIRIEHAGDLVSGSDTVRSWEQAGVIPVPNIVLLHTFGSFIPRYFGKYARKGRFPLRSLKEAGWRVSSGSDAIGDAPDVTNPLFGIQAAVARRAFDGELVEPDEALTVEEALRMYTIDGAATLGEEATLGSLESGKRADIVVLDRDPREQSVDEIRNVNVDFVFLGGKEVYRRPGATPPNKTVP